MLNKVESLVESVEAAIREFREGRMLIVTDDANRENEGDLILAAEKVTPEAVNFMVTHGRGLVCVPMTEDRLDALDLRPMVERNTDLHGTAFTISVDARGRGVTTGISAYDRAETIKALLDPKTRPEDLRRPGHIFPLCACEGGVLERTGHTEASVDLARLAGLSPAGILCEILNEDGTMARMPQLEVFAQKHGLRILTIRDLVEYRLRRERIVARLFEKTLTTEYGPFRFVGYSALSGSASHLALVCGEIGGGEDVLVRVHAENAPKDLFGVGVQSSDITLSESMRRIQKEGRGVLVFLRPEEARKSLVEQFGAVLEAAPSAADQEPPLREYGVGAQILLDLGVKSMRILTNTPRRLVAVSGYGLEITGAVELKQNEKNGRALSLVSNE